MAACTSPWTHPLFGRAGKAALGLACRIRCRPGAGRQQAGVPLPRPAGALHRRLSARPRRVTRAAAPSKARPSRWCSPRPRPIQAASPAASTARPGEARVDPAAQRARDSDARRILADELKREEERLAAAAEGIQQRRARAPRRRAQLPEVHRARGRDEGGHRPQGSGHRRTQARTGQAAAVKRSRRRPAGRPPGFEAFDQLATMVALVGRWALPAGQLGAGKHRGHVAPQPAAWQHLRLAARPGATARDAAAGGRQPGGHQPLRRPAQAPVRRRRRTAGARHRQPDRVARPGAGGDHRDRAADPAGPRRAHPRPGAGQQGTGAQPGARDQEPAGRHSRRGAAAGHGADIRAS
jgi:hypothetical protein